MKKINIYRNLIKAANAADYAARLLNAVKLQEDDEGAPEDKMLTRAIHAAFDAAELAAKLYVGYGQN